MSILVIGGTRGTGKLCVELLLARGERVRLAARNSQKAQAMFGTRVDHVQIDLEKPGQALEDAFLGIKKVIFTAAVPAGPARDRRVKAVDYDGVAATVAAAKKAGFSGRFIYMTTIGLHHRSFFISFLNFIKGGNFVSWRVKAEDAVKASELDAVVVRAAALTNGGGGKQVQVTSGDRPLTFLTWVSRADVASTIIAKLDAADPSPRDVSVVNA